MSTILPNFFLLEGAAIAAQIAAVIFVIFGIIWPAIKTRKITLFVICVMTVNMALFSWLIRGYIQFLQWDKSSSVVWHRKEIDWLTILVCLIVIFNCLVANYSLKKGYSK